MRFPCGTLTQLYGTLPELYQCFGISLPTACYQLLIPKTASFISNVPDLYFSTIRFLHPTMQTLHLISDTLRPILYINDTATLKAILRQYMLHDLIIPVSIYPDIRPRRTPVQTSFRHPFLLSVRCQPVNHSIRFVIEPCTFINLLISRIFSKMKQKVPRISPCSSMQAKL